ncbi:uncharacterized protein LOC116601389 [Nematostella vectensis]|uniref:uncharacterized protein LOC116601389 n=1 Tax=Nematostella vectensis TaxID=45351 RepID=UPI0013902971|nr:uncharacterized protein LOC116601389 [Nematostella vectensis]XP_048583891.1 uncharacterized protein LOC116601389 [Nematostella vectensis]
MYFLRFFCLTVAVMNAFGEMSVEDKKQIVVMSLPGEEYTQYNLDFQDIAEFIKEMDQKTKGLDHFIIIHDRSGRKFFEGYNFTNAHLIEMEKPGLDLWMRDFPPIMPKQQVNFTYKPQYISHEQALKDKAGFNRLAYSANFPELRQSKIVLEGGNIVENGKDIAITTARIYSDNPGMTKQDLIATLSREINRTVVVLPDPTGTTGHSDGVVSFVEEDSLLIALFDDADGPSFYDEMEAEVVKLFPSLKINPLPCYAKKGKTQGFVSSEGAYANSLVTNNAVYLPFFKNQTSNEKALAAFKNSTTKTVVPVTKTQYIPVLGGSLRCMTWQIDQHTEVGKRLLAYAKTSPKPSSDGVSIGSSTGIAVFLGLVTMLLCG